MAHERGIVGNVALGPAAREPDGSRSSSSLKVKSDEDRSARPQGRRGQGLAPPNRAPTAITRPLKKSPPSLRLSARLRRGHGAPRSPLLTHPLTAPRRSASLIPGRCAAKCSPALISAVSSFKPQATLFQVQVLRAKDVGVRCGSPATTRGGSGFRLARDPSLSVRARPRPPVVNRTTVYSALMPPETGTARCQGHRSDKSDDARLCHSALAPQHAQPGPVSAAREMHHRATVRASYCETVYVLIRLPIGY
ncbi:hypothetical protein AAFF_G00118180 [Aldrovandia affinis]|uniref:Uncharacterized protein n=1 Tax=Aldrovandia affinis TaxID=143900 RepID=A0AAD7RSJ2_9TELE|nr:hypothetical protein AAFF_G00118180 [Aldrovandia affinis]